MPSIALSRDRRARSLPWSLRLAIFGCGAADLDSCWSLVKDVREFPVERPPRRPPLRLGESSRGRRVMRGGGRPPRTGDRARSRLGAGLGRAGGSTGKLRPDGRGDRGLDARRSARFRRLCRSRAASLAPIGAHTGRHGRRLRADALRPLRAPLRTASRRGSRLSWTGSPGRGFGPGRARAQLLSNARPWLRHGLDGPSARQPLRAHRWGRPLTRHGGASAARQALCRTQRVVARYRARERLRRHLRPRDGGRRPGLCRRSRALFAGVHRQLRPGGLLAFTAQTFASDEAASTPFALGRDLRFSHSPATSRALSVRAASTSCCWSRPHPARERSVPVAGLVVVASKP